MAKNKVNTGLFDTNDLIEDAKANIQKTNENPAEIPVKKNIIKRETKSKRVNLLVKPSVYEAIVAKAEENGVSVNELINGYMEDILKQ